ncbi:MAG TPA: 16S rRNA (guanine(527)-N(7))-methyltransferase RsmG [Gammaproteobacteria bacterium]|nr:16S rRNA (guanine(527)-N(7))-methyltransferase RsmG [Gammaproteobacteria bacterium]
MNNLKNFLHEVLIANHHSLPSATEEKLLAYLELLKKWNRVYNLTAIRDWKDSILLHIIDSLSIRPYLHGNYIIDVGTGAGLPGIPLALVCHEKQFCLLDSNSKKTRFLSQVMYELELKNVEVVHARCEDFIPSKKFDSILSRAFASIQVMLESTEHLLAKDGQFLAMKGLYPEAEIKIIQPPFYITAVHKLAIKGLEAERHLVCTAKKE